MQIKFDIDLCIYCGNCISVCPMNVLNYKQEKDKRFIHIYQPDNCIMCNKCVQICQERAMTFTQIAQQEIDLDYLLDLHKQEKRKQQAEMDQHKKDNIAEA